MEHVPGDILRKILLLSVSHTDMGQLSRVNKQISILADSEQVWKLYFQLVYKYETEKRTGMTVTDETINAIQNNFKLAVQELRKELSTCVVSFGFGKSLNYEQGIEYQYYFTSEHEYILIRSKIEYSRYDVSSVETSVFCVQTNVTDDYVSCVNEHAVDGNKHDIFKYMRYFENVNRTVMDYLEKTKGLIYAKSSIKNISKIITCMFVEHYDYMMSALEETFLRIVQKTSIRKLIDICSEKPQLETSDSGDSDEQVDTPTHEVPDTSYYYPDSLAIRELCSKIQTLQQ